MSETYATPTEAPLLEVEDLRVEFRTRDGVAKVLNGVTYHVNAGETLAVLGESGSGKSVTAQAIMGILDMPPAVIPRGEIWFEGRNLLTLPAEEQRKVRGPGISMIFQDALSSLNPVYSVGYQIGEMFRAHRGMSKKDAKKQAVELMDRVRIPAASTPQESLVASRPRGKVHISDRLLTRPGAVRAICCAMTPPMEWPPR